jgi:deoxyxylulose-5-phosphate synthase
MSPLLSGHRIAERPARPERGRQLEQLAQEIRDELVRTLYRAPAHFASNLIGVVEFGHRLTPGIRLQP